ncbi:methyltransferase domain-containing protein [Methylobacterium trifolii]|uniref:Trans-aconitate 2-methyltransferase n=1 Tax=Methylobacterium trifolii TaxID=1003092 RepID=A0ABQ4U8C2_9HYPH|nr:methyltransferase domain-containing protein [Methylobacterium trifolii]GJE62648.1 Trans-aconitate 2-methyltransferase [Methylobacterium trifolii]
MNNNSYQSFGPNRGHSDSHGKLSALQLPELKGRSFLDVGCNEGFFCWIAASLGAKEVSGLDASREALQIANSRCPFGDFVCADFDSWNDNRLYDVILLASAIHYSRDQEKLIDKLVDKLTRTGVLVLEIGIVPGAHERWEEVTRAFDTRLFPTRSKLESILQKHAFRVVGQSVHQVGDPVQRWVVHIRRMKRTAIIVSGESNSGKTTLVRSLFDYNKKFLFSSFDILFARLASGSWQASNNLKESLFKVDLAHEAHVAIERLVAQPDLFREFISEIIPKEDHQCFILDGYFPEASRNLLVTLLEEKEYLVWSLHNLSSMEAFREGQNNNSLASNLIVENNNYYILGDCITGAVDQIIVNSEKLFISGWAVGKWVDEQVTHYAIKLDEQQFSLITVNNPVRADVIAAGFAFGDPKIGFDVKLVFADLRHIDIDKMRSRLTSGDFILLAFTEKQRVGQIKIRKPISL